MNFKVGDRVKIVGEYNGVLNDVYGTIRLVDECEDELPDFILADKEVDGKCYCWADEDSLETINEPEEKGKMNIETKQIFATRTKTLRKERGLSQTELAAALDISRTSVNLYESASRVPDITVLARYASFFSVTSDYLLGLSENRTVSKRLKEGWEIVISSDGDDTIAKLYKDGSLAQVDVVSRYYKDEYSMEVAAKEVVKKLFEPHGFTGKAMLVGKNTNDDGFTRGKIYQFTDGKCVDDEKCARPYDYATTLNEDDWYSNVFIEVVE